MGTEKMGWKDFKEKMLTEAMKQTGNEAQIHEVVKNNGQKMYGICFLPDRGNVMPVLYLEGYYQYYRTHSFDETVEAFLKDYEENRTDADIDIRFFTEYEMAEKYLGLRLVNYEMNRELLEHVPYKRYLDLAAVPHYLIGQGKAASVLINNNHIKMWGVNEDEVFRRAEENMRDSYEVRSMYDILKETIKEITAELELENVGQMYVATNKTKLYGASVLLFSGILEKFAAEQQVKEIVILPSSVHEAIFLPQTVNTTKKDIESLREMVRSVNIGQLKPEEVLSDNVYVYDTGKREIYIA